MHSIIAMAGLAEAAYLYALLIAAAGLAVVAFFLAFAWWRRSTVASTIACLLCLLVGWFLQPWSVFAPPSSNDSDEAYWLVRWRVASGAWACFCVASLACWRITVRRRTVDSLSKGVS